jgi:ketosteroid isomerase-like protein
MAARTPEECDRLFAEYAGGGDLDALVALYEPGASFLRQDRSVATGLAAIREELAGLVAAKPRFRMNVTQVVRAGDDLAVLYNDWTVTLSGREMTGRALEIVRRQPGGTWRFVVDDPHGRG